MHTSCIMSTILKNTNFFPAALLVTLGSCSSRLNIYKHGDICSREIQVQREIKGSQESQVCRETLVPLAGRATRGWWACQDHKEKSEPQGHKDLQETLAFQGPGWVINPAEIDWNNIGPTAVCTAPSDDNFSLASLLLQGESVSLEQMRRLIQEELAKQLDGEGFFWYPLRYLFIWVQWQ